MEQRNLERATRWVQAALDDALLFQSRGQALAVSFGQNIQNAGELLEYGDFEPENEQERAVLDAYMKCVALMSMLKSAGSFNPAYAEAVRAVAKIEEVQQCPKQ